MKTVCIILAGGSGNRLWPLSTEKHPKIILEIFHNKTMLSEAIFRAKLFANEVFLITKKITYNSIKEEITSSGIDESHVIIEPSSADTAAAVAFATSYVKRLFGSKTILIFTPSDCRIQNYGAFYRDTKFAIKSATSSKSIVMFGIIPTFAATGYGYLKIGKQIGHDQRETLFRVDSFHEKPNSALAQKYLVSGDYFWNSGIFIGKVASIERSFALDIELNKWYKSLSKPGPASPMPEKFHDFQFEYNLVEKLDKLIVVMATFDWADIGSYTSLYEISTITDNHGNSVDANVSIEDCNNCLIIGHGKKIVALGLDDIAIVDQPDGILVCRKSTHSQLVGEVATRKAQLKNG